LREPGILEFSAGNGAGLNDARKREIMKKLLIAAVAFAAFGSAASADQFVNGYVTKRGTYVAPHYRSNADQYQSNNYTYRGNTNPYTGQRGTQDYQPRRGSLYGTVNRCPAKAWC
jgi:opacity protein-like surface antigen